MTVGLRISGDEMNADGLDAETVIAVCQAIEGDGVIDYVNVIAGSSASAAGWVHVFPPMAMEQGYVAPYAAAIKQALTHSRAGGRAHQPAADRREQIIAHGPSRHVRHGAGADLRSGRCRKRREAGRLDDIRACIGCNQACVGHRLNHHRISCIQRPETGREALLRAPASRRVSRRSVMVVGGGPGGMKAAVTAARRGHRVSLYERGKGVSGARRLLAQLLPGRAEFGGLITNLGA